MGRAVFSPTAAGGMWTVLSLGPAGCCLAALRRAGPKMGRDSKPPHPDSLADHSGGLMPKDPSEPCRVGRDARLSWLPRQRVIPHGLWTCSPKVVNFPVCFLE